VTSYYDGDVEFGNTYGYLVWAYDLCGHESSVRYNQTTLPVIDKNATRGNNQRKLCISGTNILCGVFESGDNEIFYLYSSDGGDKWTFTYIGRGVSPTIAVGSGTNIFWLSKTKDTIYYSYNLGTNADIYI